MNKNLVLVALCLIAANVNAIENQYTAKVFLEDIKFKNESAVEPDTGLPSLTVTGESASPYYYSSPNIFKVQNKDNTGESFNYLNVIATLKNQSNSDEYYSYYSDAIYAPNFTTNIDMHAFYGSDIEFPVEGYVDVDAIFKVRYLNNSWQEISSRTKTETKSFRLFAPNWTPPSEINLTMNMSPVIFSGFNGNDLSYGYTEDTTIYGQNYGSATGNDFNYRGKDFKLNSIVFTENGSDCTFLAAVRSTSGRDAAMLGTDTSYSYSNSAQSSSITVGPYSHEFSSTSYSRVSGDNSTQYYTDFGEAYIIPSYSPAICDILNYIKTNPTANINIKLNSD